MKHYLTGYDVITDRLRWQLEITPIAFNKACDILGRPPENSLDGCFPLSPEDAADVLDVDCNAHIDRNCDWFVETTQDPR